MKRNRALLEKIAVACMFVSVLVVFSFANRDTQKLIRLHSKVLTRVNNLPLSVPPSFAEQSVPVSPSR